MSVLMGGLSAVSLGVSDFLASQSSERIGAARALAGMLLVSSVALTLAPLLAGNEIVRLDSYSVTGLVLSVLHGITMALALLMFFHAMAIGPIGVVAPIVAAHPVFIIAYAVLLGAFPSVVQFGAVGAVLIGVACVAGGSHVSIGPSPSVKAYAPLKEVVLLSLAASVFYGAAIIALQQAAQDTSEYIILWCGRVFGLLTIIVVSLIGRRTLVPPSRRWWPFFVLHGMLDTGGLLFILLGSSGGAHDAIVAVIASTFPVITVLLAWAVLKERLAVLQLIGIGGIIAGIAILGSLAGH